MAKIKGAIVVGFSNFCRHKKGYLKVYFEIASLFFNM